MKSQFEYAKDHIEQLRVTSGLDGQGSYQSSDGFEAGYGNRKYTNLSGFLELVLNIAIIGIFIYGIQKIMLSEKGGMNMKGDFDFK